MPYIGSTKAFQQAVAVFFIAWVLLAVIASQLMLDVTGLEHPDVIAEEDRLSTRVGIGIVLSSLAIGYLAYRREIRNQRLNEPRT